MQNYNLPSVNYDNTFKGVKFVLPNDIRYDLTGATVKIYVRKTVDSPVIFKFEVPGGIEVTLPYTITLKPTVVDIAPGLYKWDLKIVFANQVEKTYIGGNWLINPVITR